MKSLSLSTPHLIIMVGIPGSGKSFFAEHFAETFNAPIINQGHLRQELFNHPSYSKDEQSIIDRISIHMLDELLKTNHTILLEGSANQRNTRTELAKKARDAGYEPLFVWVQTESITAKKRSLKPSASHLALTSDQFDNQLKQFSAPHQTEKAIVISGKHTYASQLKIILKHLAGPRAEINNQPVAPRHTPGRSILIR